MVGFGLQPKPTTRQTPEGHIEQICLEPFGDLLVAATSLTWICITRQLARLKPQTRFACKKMAVVLQRLTSLVIILTACCVPIGIIELLCLLAANLIQEAIQHRERSRHFLHHSPLNGRGPIRRGGFTPVRCVEFLYLPAPHLLQERFKGTRGPQHRTQLPPAGGPGKLQRARPRFPSRSSVHPRDGIP